MKTNLADRM